MKRLAAAMLVASGALLGMFASCSNADTAAPTQADAQADASMGDVGSADSTADTGDATPIFNADGWLRIDYPNCDLYAAPTADKMPAPLVWEACPSVVGPLGITCNQIKSTWPAPIGGSSQGAWLFGGFVDASGIAWLALGYATGQYNLSTVAEVDGPFRQAISSSILGECFLTRGRLAQGKAVWTVVREKKPTKEQERGAIGGDVESVPLALEHWDPGAGRSYYAGPGSYFELGSENAVKSWTPGAPPLGTVLLTDPGQMAPRTFVGDELFYEVNNLSYGRIKVYSPAKGARDLVSFGNLISKRAADFGTDGNDMVWVEASGRTANNEPWTTIDIMTTKYTADASAIQKRRLRSEGSAIGLEPFAVGCGYAAHYVSTASEGNIVRIVRLSDGQSWKLPEIFVDGGYWFFQTPYVITCEELFVAVLHDGVDNVARIRLDSLGPGQAPD